MNGQRQYIDGKKRYDGTLWVKLVKVGYKRTIQGLYYSMQKLGIYKKTPSKKKGEQPKDWVSGTYPGEKFYQYTAIDEFTRIRYTWFTNEHSTYSSSEFAKLLVRYFVVWKI